MMKKNKIKKKLGTIRIISGKWRGRRINLPDVQGLRPTPNRVRETLFNWLQTKIKYSRCLDLFAGSGALGFEAASRGATYVDLVETNSAALKLLQSNCQLLYADNCEVIKSTAEDFLNSNNKIYDIVFIDPPYLSNVWTKISDLLIINDTLSENACIYMECPKNQDIPHLPKQWKLLKNEIASNVQYRLFINKIVLG